MEGFGVFFFWISLAVVAGQAMTTQNFLDATRPDWHSETTISGFCALNWVTCEADEVTKIVNWNSPSGATLPFFPVSMTEVSVGGALTGFPVGDWSSLPNLHKLYFYTSSTFGEFPDVSQSNIRRLGLWGISGGSPDNLPRSIQYLGVQNSRLDSLNIACGGDCPELVQIQVTNASFTTPGTTIEISSGVVLESLQLREVDVSGPIPSFPTSLTSLALVDNNLSGPIPDFDHLNLTQLQLTRTFSLATAPSPFPLLPDTLTSAFLEYLPMNGTMTNLPAAADLEQLYVRGCNISGALPDFSALTPNILEIVLDQNQLSGSLTSVPSTIEILRLDHNQLTGPFPNLSSYDELYELYLFGNEFSGPLLGSQPSSLSEFDCAGDYEICNVECPWSWSSFRGSCLCSSSYVNTSTASYDAADTRTHACATCSSVGNASSTATLTCTSASDSRVSACAEGYEINSTGTSDVCTYIESNSKSSASMSSVSMLLALLVLL